MKQRDLQQIFQPGPRGVVGLVDDLLFLCRDRGLELSWDADYCRVRFLSNETDDVFEIPLAKSVFRAVLARVAALCNERRPNSVSPYGGTGQFWYCYPIESPILIDATFTNTPAEQRVSLARVSE